jgi:putative tryptophan/tyrosine transport system substrate-binding protein
VTLKRRDFLTLLGGAAAWPQAARAQPQALPVVGYLRTGSPDGDFSLAGFRKGLGEMGYLEGRNVTIEYRWAQNDYGRLPELAADLARRQVAVIAASPTSAALAAKAATMTIPIVFQAGGDAVEAGLIGSLGRAGGNVTGINSMATELGPKRVEVLHELLPKAERFGFLINPNIPNVQSAVSAVQAAAAALGCSVRVVAAATNQEIDAAIDRLAQERIEGLAITPAVLFNDRRVQLATLTARNALPTVFADRVFAEIGGLASYSASLAELYRQLGTYAGRVLKGEKPSEMPVIQPTKFELVINLQTARTLRIEVPPTLLAIADEVIE